MFPTPQERYFTEDALSVGAFKTPIPEERCTAFLGLREFSVLPEAGIMNVEPRTNRRTAVPVDMRARGRTVGWMVEGGASRRAAEQSTTKSLQKDYQQCRASAPESGFPRPRLVAVV